MTHSSFNDLPLCPDDPILQLMLDARHDPNPLKVDLSAGVYKDETGRTPILECIREAERRRLQQEDTKSYLGLAGDTRFNALVTNLVLGSDHPAIADQRVSTIQTTGGSGAIRIVAELLKKIRRGMRVWVSDPTWANHIPLLKAAELELSTYPYYRPGESGLSFAAMMETLRTAQAGDAVLIQGSSHNPCGEDLSLEQWHQLTDLVLERGLLPFVDVAYHGIANTLDEDAAGWRYMAERVPEMLIAYSGSKSFSLYRDRAGALLSISADARVAHRVMTNLMTISRVVYSVPPAHGAFVVAEVLADAELHTRWIAELTLMRERIRAVRAKLSDELASASGSNRFEFIRHQNGMFSFLGINPEQARRLRAESSIYLLDSGRINIAGLTSATAPHVARAVAEVIR